MPNNEWGDFQTPPQLVEQVLHTLPHRSWRRVLEPTCGTGNFMHALTSDSPVDVLGIEQDASYAEQAASAGRVINRSIFDLDLSKDLEWSTDGSLLVVGNPPWVTNAALSSLRSINLPEKRNFKSLSGFDALTGASNFDIAEYIWLKLIVELEPDQPTIALLCKTHVARNVLSYCAQFGIGLSSASMRRIDSMHWFGAAVDACLFTLEVGGSHSTPVCEVFETLDSDEAGTRIGVVDDKLVSNIDTYERTRAADGQSPVEWRQGVKHDAARVMELRVDGGRIINGSGESVAVEPDYVFPLLKCTDLFRDRLHPTRRMVVPQRSLSDDTASLAADAPRLWAYLTAHGDALDCRKSSIYRNRCRFAVFGVGPYTFAPYKVAISGLHKKPHFRIVGPVDGQPVVFDDTCYFVPFEHPAEAALVCSLLSTQAAIDLLESLTFWDAKRPITKKLLSRLNLAAIAASVDSELLYELAADAYRSVTSAPQPVLWADELAQLMQTWTSALVMPPRRQLAQKQLSMLIMS